MKLDEQIIRPVNPFQIIHINTLYFYYSFFLGLQSNTEYAELIFQPGIIHHIYKWGG